jgi:hypothetical protein
MAEEDDGGKEQLSETELGSQIFYTAMFGLHCQKRNTVGLISGINQDVLSSS